MSTETEYFVFSDAQSMNWLTVSTSVGDDIYDINILTRHNIENLHFDNLRGGIMGYISRVVALSNVDQDLLTEPAKCINFNKQENKMTIDGIVSDSDWYVELSDRVDVFGCDVYQNVGLDFYKNKFISEMAIYSNRIEYIQKLTEITDYVVDPTIIDIFCDIEKQVLEKKIHRQRYDILGWMLDQGLRVCVSEKNMKCIAKNCYVGLLRKLLKYEIPVPKIDLIDNILKKPYNPYRTNMLKLCLEHADMVGFDVVNTQNAIDKATWRGIEIVIDWYLRHSTLTTNEYGLEFKWNVLKFKSPNVLEYWIQIDSIYHFGIDFNEIVSRLGDNFPWRLQLFELLEKQGIEICLRHQQIKQQLIGFYETNHHLLDWYYNYCSRSGVAFNLESPVNCDYVYVETAIWLDAHGFLIEVSADRFDFISYTDNKNCEFTNLIIKNYLQSGRELTYSFNALSDIKVDLFDTLTEWLRIETNYGIPVKCTSDFFSSIWNNCARYTSGTGPWQRYTTIQRICELKKIFELLETHNKPILVTSCLIRCVSRYLVNTEMNNYEYLECEKLIAWLSAIKNK